MRFLCVFCAVLCGFARLFFVVAVVFSLFGFHYVDKKDYAHKHDKPDQNPHFVGVEKDLHLFPKRLCLSDFFLKIFDCVADCGQCDFFHYSSTRISAATFFTPSRAVISFNAFSMNNIVTQGKINVKSYPEFLSNINQIQGHLEHV